MELFLALVRMFEGLRLTAYLCPAGVWTIGYGSTGPDVGPGVTWSREQAEFRLHADAAVFWSGAARLCPACADNTNQRAALADFAYNLGLTRLAASTLRRKFNANDIDGAAAELPRWVHAGHRVLPGLVLRRATERIIFLSPNP